MLRQSYLALLAVGVIASTAIFSCGGDSDSGSTSKKDGGGGTGTGGGGGPDEEKPGAQPPTKPADSPATGTTETVIAIRKLFLGETDPATGTTDSTAWKNIGYNLDGIISTKTGTNHCKFKDGGSKSAVQTDGTDGIDNSFGSNLIPIISSLASDPSSTISESLNDGSFTIMVRLTNLDSNTNQTGVNGSLLGGSPFDALVDCEATPADVNCSAPKWDGTDKWPVVPELLTSPPDIDSAKLKFPNSFVSNGTWVSGDQGTLALTVSIQGFNLSLNITKAVITMNIAGTGTSAKATGGIIAGVIPTESLISELKKVAGGFDPTLCDGPTFDSIATQIAAASDIMQDGTNGNPDLECDGISIGLGFEGQAVQLGGVADAASAPEDPCAVKPDAGTGGTGGTGDAAAGG